MFWRGHPSGQIDSLKPCCSRSSIVLNPIRVKGICTRYISSPCAWVYLCKRVLNTELPLVMAVIAALQDTYRICTYAYKPRSCVGHVWEHGWPSNMGCFHHSHQHNGRGGNNLIEQGPRGEVTTNKLFRNEQSRRVWRGGVEGEDGLRSHKDTRQPHYIHRDDGSAALFLHNTAERTS